MVIVQMGNKNLQEKLVALVRAVHESSCWMTLGLWPKDPIHGKTSKGSSGLKTNPSKHHLGIKCILLEEEDYSLNLLLNGVWSYLQAKLHIQTYSLSNIQNGVLKDLIIGSAETLCGHFSDLFIFFSFQFFFFPPLHLSYIMYLWKCLTCTECYTLFTGLSVKSNVIERIAFLELTCCCI
jgi:hypothetical protein